MHKLLVTTNYTTDHQDEVIERGKQYEKTQTNVFQNHNEERWVVMASIKTKRYSKETNRQKLDQKRHTRENWLTITAKYRLVAVPLLRLVNS